MLKKLFPESHGRYLSFPILGPVLDDFDDWLIERGYTRMTRIQRICATIRIERFFQDRGLRCLGDIAAEDFHACRKHYEHQSELPGTIGVLQQFLKGRGLLSAPADKPSFPFRSELEPYAAYLKNVRGFAPNTVYNHLSTLSQFLEHLQPAPSRPVNLTLRDLEDFIVRVGRRLGRGSMQHVVAHLRGYLRFLVMKGELPSGLDTQIDTARQYRQEKLPRALPWETVCDFLNDINRRTAVGRRDYAMFLMMATYGLRASDIVALPLENVRWRQDELCIHQRKTGQMLVLPLTDAVGAALLDYLRRGRPQFTFRQLFLSVRAPVHPIRNTALGVAFQYWAKQSGLKIPFYYGPGCLRHSFAVHLLRQGISVKTIGDLLGHRTAESTCVYLRLALEDLREVALSLPKAEEVAP